ncbi:unnamed protein product [Linum trigynum]|uniref:Uncharacterized protein n=1 Tax=Linum trigynum TaxID=586398 RepID=A0AAV2CTL8_9ROSI
MASFPGGRRVRSPQRGARGEARVGLIGTGEAAAESGGSLSSSTKSRAPCSASTLVSPCTPCKGGCRVITYIKALGDIPNSL